MADELDFQRLASLASDEQAPEIEAPARLKSRTYTALIHRQRESGPLLGLTASKRSGRKLCVFEELVEIAPVGSKMESVFFCQVCHARVLAENFEHAPIWWAGCPYVRFQNR
ncbi:MAG: hypothetical protein AAB225_05560 [Acidobacteriota bacterium]